MKPQGSILLADDEETFLEATKDLLEEEGYVCHGVRDATELSEALNVGQFDLLITDLNMPGNQIMEKVSELREQSKIMPVIVVTGYPSVPTAVESVRLNVLEYMIKPVNFPILLSAVERGLTQKRALNTLASARQGAEKHLANLSDIEDTLKTFPALIDEHTRESSPTKLPSASSTEPPSDELSIPSTTNYFRLRESVFHTIQILQKTKSAFRSKDLAGLRKYLETVLQETSEPLKKPGNSSDIPFDE